VHLYIFKSAGAGVFAELLVVDSNAAVGLMVAPEMHIQKSRGGGNGKIKNHGGKVENVSNPLMGACAYFRGVFRFFYCYLCAVGPVRGRHERGGAR